MTALPTPKLADLDDPLQPRRDPAPAAGPATPAPASPAPQTPRRRSPAQPAASKAAAEVPSFPTLADEPLVAVFARLPESLSDRLADGVRALNAGRPRRARISQQDLLGTLVDQHVAPDDPAGVRELGELVDAYRQRVRR